MTEHGKEQGIVALEALEAVSSAWGVPDSGNSGDEATGVTAVRSCLAIHGPGSPRVAVQGCGLLGAMAGVATGPAVFKSSLEMMRLHPTSTAVP